MTPRSQLRPETASRDEADPADRSVPDLLRTPVTESDGIATPGLPNGGPAEGTPTEPDLEQRLSQAHKMDVLGLLAAGMAHDLNNLLATILGSAELLKDRLGESSPLLTRVEAILQAGRSASGMTRRVLAFSRTTEDRQVPLDLTVAVRDALQALSGSVPANVRLVDDLRSGVWVEGDPAQFQQIVLNLAINAIQAMAPRGGTLEVTLDEELPPGESRTGRWAVLTVRDTGCGMTPQVQERIFEPFFTTKPAGEGTGLGLAMVHAGVTRAGGRITVRSAPGQGTLFRIQLPCADGLQPGRAEAAPEPRPGTAPAPARPYPVPGTGVSVLLAASDPAARTILRGRLERAGHRVQEARDGLEAWEMFSQAGPGRRFDLLFTALDMPRMDGMELIQLVRRQDPVIPIAALPTSEERESVLAALHLGVDEFLGQAFQRKELDTCLEALLRLREQRLEARRSRETAQDVRRAQRSLVAVPEKGMPLYTLYQPLTDAGGDLFRCFPCADGSILFLLADVAGHSVLSSYAVAAFLGMVSSMVGECPVLQATAPDPATGRRALLCDQQRCAQFGQAPCDPLPHLAGKLNRASLGGPFANVPVSALLGLWNPATGNLRLLNAGIPHGLRFSRTGGETRPIEINGTPLGVFAEPALETATLDLRPGDRMLFGTDGFFEVTAPDRRRFQDSAGALWTDLAGRPLDQALSGICQAARDHGAGRIADDLLVIGFEQPPLARAPGNLEFTLPATLQAVDLACTRLRGFLQEAPPAWSTTPERRFDITLAVREALLNAVFHGNRSRPGSLVALRCRPDPAGGRLEVTVRDEGPGFDPDRCAPPLDPLAEHGRGLPLIRHLAEQIRTEGGALTLVFCLEDATHDHL